MYSIDGGSTAFAVTEYDKRNKKKNYQEHAKTESYHEKLKALESEMTNYMNKDLGKLNYYHQPVLEDPFQGAEVCVDQDSINRILVSEKLAFVRKPGEELPYLEWSEDEDDDGLQNGNTIADKNIKFDLDNKTTKPYVFENRVFVAAEMIEGVTRRVIAKNTTQMPRKDMLAELLVLIFGGSPKLDYDFGKKRLTGVRFHSSNLQFKQWFDENDIDTINILRRTLRNFFVDHSIAGCTKSFWSDMIELLMKRKRYPYVEPDKWWEHWKRTHEKREPVPIRERKRLRLNTTKMGMNAMPDVEGDNVVMREQTSGEDFMPLLALPAGYSNDVHIETMIKRQNDYLKWKRNY